ncbi:MAG: DivIVA domain-containing protein [Thermodesulfobacteriota bacterium]|nr:DivIVA domain-containing protein [Thermodesulfobacteriota bacterium]
MRTTPDMLREQRFKTRMKGFDKDEVIYFLSDLADDMDVLYEENDLLKLKLDKLETRQTELEEVLLSAKKFSDERLEHAREEAQRLMDEAKTRADDLHGKVLRKMEGAQTKAEGIQAKAEQHAKEIKDAAKQKAEEILSEVQTEKTGLERDIIELKAKKSSLFSELKAVLDSQMSWIKELVNVDTGKE